MANNGVSIFIMGCLALLASVVGVAIILVSVVVSCTLNIYCPEFIDIETVPAPAIGQNNAAEISEPKGEFSTQDAAKSSLIFRKKLVVGYAIDTGPFSYDSSQSRGSTNDSEGIPTGLETEMIREFVRSSFDSFSGENLSDEKIENIIEWVPIFEFERIDASTRNDIDIVIGAVSHTKERCTTPERICTTVFHWQDNAALMVHKDADISSFCSPELEGKNIAVIANTTSEFESVNSDRFATCQPTVDYGVQIPYSTRRQAIESVASVSPNNTDISAVAAYITDRRMLEFYRENFGYSDDLKIVGKAQQPEQYVFILKKENDGLRELLDDSVAAMMKSPQWNQWLDEYNLSSEITN